VTAVRAPFTPGQVASLNAYQASGAWHEFTCGNDDCPRDQAILIAREDGWHCPACPHTQDRAHDIMTDWSWQGITVRINDGPPVKGMIVSDEETR
jgi:hypothetical protein